MVAIAEAMLAREHLTEALCPDGKENRSNPAPEITFGDSSEGDRQVSGQTFEIADLPTRRYLS
jgi:hypothetical protein